jgi:4a-hydroxytetrahydrobiopterin dehydratase
MSRPNLLSSDEIQIGMKNIPDWILDENKIVKEVICSNFASAIGLINSIAVFAESADHHPDILIYGWNKVRVSLFTHDKGGLTSLDFDLAKKIDSIKIY